jgi:hypothetical protein
MHSVVGYKTKTKKKKIKQLTQLQLHCRDSDMILVWTKSRS